MSDREKFEAWARTDEGNCADYDLARKTAPWTDEYRNDLVQRDWEVWQASRRATLEEAANACLVATPDAAMRKALGDAAHYVACSKAVRALAEGDKQ